MGHGGDFEIESYNNHALMKNKSMELKCLLKDKQFPSKTEHCNRVDPTQR